MSVPDPAPGQPPQVVYIQGKPPRSLIKKVAIGCVVGSLALGTLGELRSCGVVGGNSPDNTYQGPGISQPYQNPTPPPPLSHVAPKLLATAQIEVTNTGGLSWIDVAVSLTNQGPLAQNVTVSLVQNGKPLVITDATGAVAVPAGALLPVFPIAGRTTLVLRVDNWQQGPPVSVVVGGNGVANDTTMPSIACPTATLGSQIACSLPGQ